MFKNPNGTDKFPARTCKDLYMSYPGLPSGMTNLFFTIAIILKVFFLR